MVVPAASLDGLRPEAEVGDRDTTCLQSARSLWQSLRSRITWTHKVCKTMALWALSFCRSWDNVQRTSRVEVVRSPESNLSERVCGAIGQ